MGEAIDVKVARHDEQIKTLFETTKGHTDMITELRQESKARDKWAIGTLVGVVISCGLLIVNLLASKM